MLELTDEGTTVAEQLWHKPRKDDKEMAFLAAADILGEYPIMDAHALANQLPFVQGHEAKVRVVQEWIKEGLIKK